MKTRYRGGKTRLLYDPFYAALITLSHFVKKCNQNKRFFKQKDSFLTFSSGKPKKNPFFDEKITT